jgi:uncharacterized protein (TIGR03067 family)
MRWIVVFLALGICANTSVADEKSAEMKKFAGTWKVKDASADGIRLPEEARKMIRLVFEGDRFAFKGGPTQPATTFTVDAAAQTIEIAPPKGETKIMRGRYKFEGATLTICLTDGEKPPDKLEGGKDRLYLILEKE